MTTATAPAWSIFTQIFAEPWDGFQCGYPRYAHRSYDGLVAQRLGCGEPDQMGDVAYRCLRGGEGPHRVAMSCQSSLGLRCAQVSVDNWVSQVSQRLHEGVIYRYMGLTRPALLRKTFDQQAQAVLSPFMRCGAQCVDECFSRVRGRPLQGGSIVVIQTPGRHGPSNPHLQIMATSGGWAQQVRQWVPLDSIPYRLWRKRSGSGIS